MENKKSSEALLTGKLLGFFFSIIGLLGCLMYPQSSEEREKFIVGWRAGFIASLLIGLVLVIVFLFFNSLA